ncbi:alpha/beta hydrolase, partial [Candidatus Gottesmanbacteria bacterium]|nr:alpha/beta hydrolase [Candidatus Gottesmanbacteria bacterium]
MTNDRVSFETVNNKKIFTVFSEADQPSKKVIIMSHGFRGSSIGPARTFVDFARKLNQENYSILRFDQPNSGNSEGDFLNSSFYEWVQTTIYFAKKYIDDGYKVGLIGQSMGATTSIYAATSDELKNKIPCIILWAPGIADLVKYKIDSATVYEEGGQKYYGSFWNEERTRSIFDAIQQYKGNIHLTFGEEDKYMVLELRKKLIDLIKNKGQLVTILKGQDHSSWGHNVTQNVYNKEIE